MKRLRFRFHRPAEQREGQDLGIAACFVLSLLMQQLLDNPFLLLFIGVMVPMIVYTLWGVIDILTVPLTK
mgnify:CR=1 FL=1